MDPFLAPHLRVLEDLRRQTAEMVAPLDDSQINRTVPGLKNSVGILLRHMAGSERYWIGEVVGGRPAQRQRDAEFEHDRVRKGDLLGEFDRVAALTREVLGGLSRDDLLQEVTLQRSQGPVQETRAYAVLHAMEHLAYHVGQLRFLTRLLERGA